MADRRRDVLLLLASRHDGLWFPSGSSTSSGFAPAVIVRCDACVRGRVRDRFGRPQTCSRCGGAGRLAFDPYDALRAPVGSSATAATARPRRRVRCDRCDGEGVWKGERCALCDGDGWRDLHVFELAIDVRDRDERDPLAAAVEARAEAGSYVELDRALERLRAWSVIRWGSLLDEVDRFRAPASTAGEQGLSFVVPRMPDPIRVPADVRANARLLRERRTRAKGRGSDPRALAERDREIRLHRRAGRSVQWIAAEYELSVATVYEVLNGRPA